MRRTAKSVAVGSSTLLIAAAASTVVHAVPMTVTSVETPSCDVLPSLSFVHELGNAPIFPLNELIDSSSGTTPFSACPTMDNPSIPNRFVRMTNLSGIAWFEVYYVADALTPLGGTSISNEDGLVNAGQAFRIDRVGVNRPLLAESFINDGIFAPGETWRFVIDDYFNTFGLPARNFSSIGVGAFSPGPQSSGSIIARVPEPTTGAALTGAAAIALLRRKEKVAHPRDR